MRPAAPIMLLPMSLSIDESPGFMPFMSGVGVGIFIFPSGVDDGMAIGLGPGVAVAAGIAIGLGPGVAVAAGIAIGLGPGVAVEAGIGIGIGVWKPQLCEVM